MNGTKISEPNCKWRECVNNSGGKCRCLTESYDNKPCPFFKDEETLSRILKECAIRNEEVYRLGKFKYKPNYSISIG